MTILSNGVRVTFLPDEIIKDAVSAGPQWRVFGDRILARTIELCPVGKTQTLGATYGQPHQGPHLRETMEVRYTFGADPYILVGSTSTLSGGVSALGVILEGTDAHEIEGKNSQSKVLRFTAGGTVMFRKRVQHPGTKANPFVQKAMQQICLEAGGAGFGS